jgi:hypothetical protein
MTPPANPVNTPAAPLPETCPDCSLAREPDGGKFCEFCGYNFTTGAHGALQHTQPSPAPPPPAQIWEVLISVDPSLRTEESPQAPIDIPPVTIRLSAPSNLIGRNSTQRAIFPEISLDSDDAVSHRHALLTRPPDGSLVLRDIGSSNGTRLNGKDLHPLTDVLITAGDQITLGHWTRIIIQAVPEK